MRFLKTAPLVYEKQHKNYNIDNDGNVVVEYYYDAWGNHKITGNTTLGNLNPFRYRGYYFDSETGLYYLQTRYYDPEVGRFLNMDSISYADPEVGFGLNLYAYCCNNPVMYVDPTGTNGEELLMFLERVFTGFADLCNYLVGHAEKLFLGWKTYHKFYPNISKREFFRSNANAINSTKALGGVFGKIATVLSLTTLSIDIGLVWYNNYKSGSSTWVSDSVVDTIYIGTRFAAGWGITTLCTALIPIPVIGTLVGIGLSIAADYCAQMLFESTGFLTQIKSWAAEIGHTITNSWNYFWSFAWI